MTQGQRTIDVRRIEVLRVSGVVQSIYERCATTKKRRLLAGQLARVIAHLWAEDSNAGRAPTQFREITDDRLNEELVRLSRLDEESDVADEAKTIHQRTIVVLADFGFVGAHHAGSDDRVRLVAAAKKALEARAYIRTKEKPITRKVVKGAPVNNRAAAARRMLAEHYKLLTGRRPTMTGRSSDYGAPAGGQFLEFTKSVFAARELAWEEAAEEAREFWKSLAPASPNNPYLKGKNVGVHGDIRICNVRPVGDKYDLETLVIPVYRDGEIISLQLINVEKWFRSGTTVKGGYFRIGEPFTGIFVIVEGYATGATIHEMTGLPVAVAFDAANMREVARVLRAERPEAAIILAGDDDWKTEKDRGFNTGKLAAEDSADAIMGVPILPPFNREKDGDKPTDWNDFRDVHGEEATGACFLHMVDDWLAQNEDLPEKPAPKSSEADLADMFNAKYGARVRYVAKWGVWLIYNGKTWREDQTERVISYARKICNHAASKLTKKKEESRARGIASAKTIFAVVKLAQSLPRIAATVEQWDADPWLLNTPKGVVDLRTGQMRPHRPEDYMTKSTAVSPGGKCPRFLKFLEEVTNDDKALIAYLQRKDGYSLTGVTNEHAVFFTFGPGRNGKSVKQNTIGHVMGDYAVEAPISTFIVTGFEQHPTDLAMLRGARLVRCSEVAKGQRWAEEKIKQMSGGDPITARFMRQDFFTYTPQFKLDFLGNVKPSLRTVDEAAKARFQMIPFTVVIPAEKRDQKLEERLKKEGPGILQWMIKGCLEWQKKGLAPPPSVVAATEEYLRKQDATESWLEEKCERNSREKFSTYTRLMASWTQWAEAAHEFVGTRTDLIDRLVAKGFEPCKTEDGKCLRGLHVNGDPTPTFAGTPNGAGNGAVKGKANGEASGAVNGAAEIVVKGKGFTMKNKE